MTKTDAVRAIKTSGQIVNGLEDLGGEATIAELDQHLSIAKSTIYKHLNTLRDEGLVTKSDDRYRFGLRFLELGGYAREYDGIYEVAKPEVRKRAEKTGEVVNLVFEEQGWGRYVFTARGDRAVDIDTHVGKRITLHSTGVGKALLSCLSDTAIADIIDTRGLPARTEQTITDAEALFEEIETIRDRGIAYDTEEHIRGMGCVAAPIEVPGRRHASVSITGPISRVTTDDVQSEYTQTIRRTANIIELNLSGE